ncbi:MAG: hypothetical protein KBC41_01755 [Candidatus Pacebacteria bacterium]|nr:hypothetical protein [Candidatus Paceibacterota bacterium]MBP9866783.1 hypothetical protein [Candidatus Paceibacterota bacterium]
MQLSHQPERSDSALDSLEHELYNPKNKMEMDDLHRVRDKKTQELPVSWGDNAPIITHGRDESGFSFGAKFLIVALILLLASVSFALYRVMSSSSVVSSANIDMSLEMNPYVEGGESSPLSFSLHNRNTVPLQDAFIVVEYKRGAGSQDEEEKVYEKRELGSINSGDFKRQDFDVVLYGAEAEQRSVTVKLEYKIAGSGGSFSKIATASTILKTPQIAVRIDGPEVLSVGQSGVFTITVKNNSATTSLPSVLQLAIPNTLTVTNYEPKLSSRGQIWSVKPLSSGESKVFTVTGYLSGKQGEVATMKAIVGAEGSNNTNMGIVYSSQTIDIKLRSSPLNFVVALDTQNGLSEKIRYGDRANLSITYTNTSDSPLFDVSIELLLSGEAPLYKDIFSQEGYYDSINKTITWDKTSIPALANVPANSNATFVVQIPMVTSGSNSPNVKMTLTGKATDKESDDVISIISKTWQVEGSASLTAKTLHKNSSLQNTGPIPPEPNIETSYTAHLLVSAQNALVNTKVSFTLPTYVSWTGVVSTSSYVTYDKKLRTVTWNIGNLAADAVVQTDINVLVKPSQTHVGKMPPITSGIVLDADEEISRSHIKTTLSPLTTYLAGENWGSEDPSRVADR